jgi:hypothetical protein
MIRQGAMEKQSPLKHQPLRLPGQSVQEEIDRLADDQLLFWALLPAVGIVFAIWEWLRWYFQWPLNPLGFTLAAILLVAFSALRLLPLRRRVRALKLGRDGERIVAENLNRLRSSGAIVFHDLRGNDFNVDHLIVAHQGIFAIETKTYSKRKGGQVTFDGKRLEVDGVRLDRDPIEQARAAARWAASKILESSGKRFSVKPVVVFPGWFVNPVKEHGGSDVWVLNPESLPAFVLNSPDALSEDDLRLVVLNLARTARPT